MYIIIKYSTVKSKYVLYHIKKEQYFFSEEELPSVIKDYLGYIKPIDIKDFRDCKYIISHRSYYIININNTIDSDYTLSLSKTQLLKSANTLIKNTEFKKTIKLAKARYRDIIIDDILNE